MEGFIKAVFLGILGMTVALILYFILFGYSGGSAWSFSSGSSNTMTGHEVLNTDTSGWKGVLFYSAEAIEHPISAYYYKYCYNVAVADYSYMDRLLGYNFSNFQTKHLHDGDVVEPTITDLSGDTQLAQVPVVGSKSSETSSTFYYTTEWQ